MNIIEYADREMLVMNVANKLAGKLKSALSGNDRVSFAVPGGSTPGRFLRCSARPIWIGVGWM